MQRSYTSVGAPIIEVNKPGYIEAMQALVWHEVGSESFRLNISWSTGELVKAAAKDFKLGCITHVGEIVTEVRYTLIGIRNRFSNGVANIYFVDRGHDAVPLASDFTPNPS